MNQLWIYMCSPPTSLSTQFLWVFPVHQARALVSCIQPGLVICFTLDNIHVLMLFSRKNMECFTNLRVIRAQRPCSSSLYRSDFSICAAKVSTVLDYYLLFRFTLASVTIRSSQPTDILEATMFFTIIDKAAVDITRYGSLGLCLRLSLRSLDYSWKL